MDDKNDIVEQEKLEQAVMDSEAVKTAADSSCLLYTSPSPRD